MRRSGIGGFAVRVGRLLAGQPASGSVVTRERAPPVLLLPSPAGSHIASRAQGEAAPHSGLQLGGALLGGQAYVVTALNPKDIAFFVAFVPQFFSPAAPFLPQAAILVGSFVTLAVVNALLYALLAGQASSLVRRPGVRRGFNRAGGGVLVGEGWPLALKR